MVRCLVLRLLSQRSRHLSRGHRFWRKLQVFKKRRRIFSVADFKASKDCKVQRRLLTRTKKMKSPRSNLVTSQRSSLIEPRYQQARGWSRRIRIHRCCRTLCRPTLAVSSQVQLVCLWSFLLRSSSRYSWNSQAITTRMNVSNSKGAWPKCRKNCSKPPEWSKDTKSAKVK